MNRHRSFRRLLLAFTAVLIPGSRPLVSAEASDVETIFESTLNNQKIVGKELISALLKNRRDLFVNYLRDNVFVGEYGYIYSIETSDGQTLNMKSDILQTIGSFTFQLDEFEKINNLKYKEYSKYADALLKRVSAADTQLLQSFFNSVYYPVIISNVLEARNLYGQDTFGGCYSFIRRVGDLVLDEQKASFPKAHLNSVLARVFPCSRRLMRAVCLDELIRKKYYKHLSKGAFLASCSVTEGSESDSLLLSVNVQAEGVQRRRFLFEKKGPGINPGFIIKSDGLPDVYVKMFHLADSKKRLPTKGELDSQKTRTHVTLSWRNYRASQSLEGSTNVPVIEFLLDLREPFLYMVLNRLGMGPEFEAVINPFIYQGMYMATRDVAVNGQKYYLFSQIQDYALKNSGFESRLLDNQSVALSLTELEIVSRLLGLRDLHAENFGFVVGTSTTLDEMAGVDGLDLRVVDFVYPGAMFSSSDLVDDLRRKKSNGLILTDRNGELTLTGKLVGDAQVMKDAFRKLTQRGGTTVLNSTLFASWLEEVRTALLEKLLELRGNSDDERSLMTLDGQPRTNAELIGFKISRETGATSLDPEVIDNLDRYIGQLISGFRQLEEEFGK